MNVETREPETRSLETDRAADAVETSQTEWVTPDFVEETACAEICAYIFTA